MKLLGQKRKYAFFWLLGTISAGLVIAYAAVRAIGSSDGDGSPTAAGVSVVPVPTTPTPSAWSTDPPTSTPQIRTPEPAPRPPPKSPGRSGVTITSPANRTKVNGRVGVNLHGRFADLGGSELRIFVLAFNGQYYLVDNGPTLNPSGRWSFLVKPIGDGTKDIGHVFTIIVATVNHTCQTTLANSNRAPDGNIAFPILPKGCTAADRVNVLKASFA